MNASHSGMIGVMPRPRSTEPSPNRQRPKKRATQLQFAVAERLIALQAEVGLTDEKIAEKIGVSRTAWTNWKNLENKPEEEALVRLCHKYAVTMDWLYRGKTDQLPVAHAVRLTARLRGMNPDEATPAVLIESPR